MKTGIVILVALWFPLFLAATVAAMVYVTSRETGASRGVRGFAVIGALNVTVAMVFPTLLLLKVL